MAKTKKTKQEPPGPECPEKQYDVVVYAVVLTKMCGIKAQSEQAAIKIAQQDLELIQNHENPNVMPYESTQLHEETPAMMFLVNETGDETNETDIWYGPDGKTPLGAREDPNAISDPIDLWEKAKAAHKPDLNYPHLEECALAEYEVLKKQKKLDQFDKGRKAGFRDFYDFLVQYRGLLTKKKLEEAWAKAENLHHDGTKYGWGYMVGFAREWGISIFGSDGDDEFEYKEDKK